MSVIYHNRAYQSSEVDAIVQKDDGTWAAFEVKLGFGAIEEASETLLDFAKIIDTDKSLAPMSLNIIVGSGFAHHRNDGINVIPLSCLKN
ncbi:MAG: DUF4143 domain-containing protein [Endomicrobium sp.]|nr:DUF4143 domain-containing protein [Endomicrobium sp.]